MFTRSHRPRLRGRPETWIMSNGRFRRAFRNEQDGDPFPVRAAPNGAPSPMGPAGRPVAGGPALACAGGGPRACGHLRQRGGAVELGQSVRAYARHLDARRILQFGLRGRARRRRHHGAASAGVHVQFRRRELHAGADHEQRPAAIQQRLLRLWHPDDRVAADLYLSVSHGQRVEDPAHLWRGPGCHAERDVGGVSHRDLLCELRHRGDCAQSPFCRDLGERPGMEFHHAYRQSQPASRCRGNDLRVRLPVWPEQPSHRRLRANRLAVEPDGLCGVVHARRAARQLGGAVLCSGTDRRIPHGRADLVGCGGRGAGQRRPRLRRDGSYNYVTIPACFPNLATDFTLTAWIRTTNNAKSGQRIFIDDQSNTGGYGFSLGDGGTGRLRFYTRAVNPIILDTPNVIQNNTWYFVAAVADIGAKTKSLYVYNQAGTQLAYVTQTYTGTWGADAGAASIGGENNASTENGSSFRFSGNLDEVGVYKGAMNAAQLSQVMSQKRPCSIVTVVAHSGFNAFETGTPAGSASGVIHTKVSASAFNLAVVALKSGGAAVETAFAGTVKLELVDASAGASCGAYGLIRSLGTLTFAAGDAGRKTLAGIVERNAWRNARIRMTYPATGAPTIVACSTANFAIRPARFGNVTVSDADSVSAGATRTLANTAVSGGAVRKAGQPFQIVATAANTAGAATSNYSGNPAASLTACVLPATGCTLGTLATGTWSAAAGTVTTTGARYSEVGAFAMKLVDASFAAVDAADGSTATEMNIESTAFNVGRFVPDHFDLAPTSTPVFKTFNDTTCATRSFTYVGQPFGYLTLPQATIMAKNAADTATLNYTGALRKLAPAGAVDTLTPAQFSNIAFDAGNEIRFGQLVLANALGSELLGLPVPIETRYWNGSGFALNTKDFCTQLSASNVSLTNWRRYLNPCETAVSLSGRFNAGRGNLRFSAPGVNNTGSVDLTVQLGAVASGSTCVAGAVTPAVAASQSWLQGHWSGAGVTYDQDPAARASFGLNRGSKPLIYLREMY